ncbi:hypothetical protein GIB67_018870, partial [Kingdonia uniflora]
KLKKKSGKKNSEDTNISNYCKFDNQLLTTFTSSLYISGLIASFVASFVTALFGRKPSILLGSTVFLAGSALGGVMINIYMLIFSRVLLGVGVEFANQVKIKVVFVFQVLSAEKNKSSAEC